MPVFRNISKSLGINALARIFAALGCLLLLISLIFPFYYIGGFTLEGPSSFYYWSYEYHYQFSTVGTFSGQYWFFGYWFRQGIPWILEPMFVIQALTLLFGVAFIIFNRKILSLASVLFSLSTIFLMFLAGMMFPVYGKYQLGFYLLFPSLILFLSAFVLNEISLKR